jgi:hypothetical protein
MLDEEQLFPRTRAPRIAVVGSRTYPTLEDVRQFVREQPLDAVIISGGARGVDQAAVNEARRLEMPYEVYPADWNRYGRGAGMIRNQTIVDTADEIVAFWDGQSPGTRDTIRRAKAAGKPVRVFQVAAR